MGKMDDSVQQEKTYVAKFESEYINSCKFTKNWLTFTKLSTR